MKNGLAIEEIVKVLFEDKFGYLYKERTGIIKENDLETIGGLKIEVKSDYKALYTGNIFAEIWDDITRGKEGWIQYCNADLFAFVSMDEKAAKPMNLKLYYLPAMQLYVLYEYLNGDFTDKEVNKKLISPWYDKKSKSVLLSFEEVEKMLLWEYDFLSDTWTQHNKDLWTWCS